MGLFGNKNKKAAEDTAADEPQGKHAAKTQKKKKKNELLSSVLDESVVDQVLSEMQANEAFVVESNDGVKSYVGMLLDTEAIGGLNKKSVKDEDKGQLIQQITSGRIKAFIPAELMAEDKIIFIPDVMSLDAMGEFGLLTDAPYTVALVAPDGVINQTGVPCVYKNFVDVLESDNPDAVVDMLEDLGVAGFESEADDEPEAMDVTTVMPAHMSDEVEDEDIPNFEEDEDIPNFEEEDEIPNFEEEDEIPNFEEESEPAYVEEPQVEDVPEPEPETVIGEDEFAEAITRKFYSDDLNLEVSTDAFDAQFIHANPFVPFSEDRGEGWLNEYVANMSREANTELRRQRTKDIQFCREMFYNLISLHCETITVELDANDPDTVYGKMNQVLQEQRNEQLNLVDETISKRRDAINEDFDKNIQQVAQDAARAAEATYRERYGRAKDDKIFALDATVRKEIESDYQDQIREMNDARRKDAAKRLDAGIMESLREVSDVWAERVSEQDALYKSYRDRISAFIDDNRKQDIAHDQALAEELAQKTKADKVMEEYRIKMQNQAASYDEQAKQLRAEIADNERAAKQHTQEIQSECDKRISLLVQEKELLQRRYDELTDKYADLDKAKDAKYETQMDQLRGENAAWNDKFDQLQAAHKKSSTLTIALTIVAVIASLAIGTLVGTNLNLGFGSDKAASESVAAVQKQLDELEEKYESEQSENKSLKSENETLKSQQSAAAAQTDAAATAVTE